MRPNVIHLTQPTYDTSMDSGFLLSDSYDTHYVTHTHLTSIAAICCMRRNIRITLMTVEMPLGGQVARWWLRRTD